ncbi:MAG: dihydropteroate synthase [Bacillota bacterium]|nr:dihydropteroate synthase [Bacillota bacterium]
MTTLREILPGLGERTLVMGVLNATPDSFADGPERGRWLDPGRAAERARAMVAEGADLIDLGAESTRPGATPVPEEEELGRLLPVLRALLDARLGVPVSVDTYKARVAEAAVAAGAALVNDVGGLSRDPAMAATLARLRVPVVLVHGGGRGGRPPGVPPLSAAEADGYVRRLRRELGELLERALAAGIERGAILLDPGVGFGKGVEEDLVLLARLQEVMPPGVPFLVGASRKGVAGRLLGQPPEERLEGSLALAVLAARAGAAVVRVHDVAATLKAVRVADAVRAAAGRGAEGRESGVEGAGAAAPRAAGAVALELRGLLFYGRHGARAYEREGLHPFRVDVLLELEPGRPADDRLADSLDYGAVARLVRSVVEGEPVNLIESLAARIGRTILERFSAFPVRGLEVRVHKPEAPLHHPFEDVAARWRWPV